MLKDLHRHRWRWYILGTLILATYPIVVSFTILSSSLGNLLSGTEQLQEARSLLVRNPVLAQEHFTQAQATLNSSLVLLQEAPWYTQLLTPLPPFRWQVRLIKATQALAESGTITSDLLKNFPPLEKTSDPSTLLSQTSTKFFQWYNINTENIQLLDMQINIANTQLQGVPNWIVPGKTAEVYSLKDEVQKIATTLPSIETLVDGTQTAFGAHDTSPHTFLVLFQNENELRMSGGFFGSFATITASGGTIRQYTFGKNIYLLDNPYTAAHPITPPPQLATITTAWGFRDSNIGAPGFLTDYSPQIAQFYTNESGQKIDGTIYIGVSVLEDILNITGPITLPDIGPVTASTISTTLTKYVEQDYYTNTTNKQIDQPKSILNSLIPLLLNKLRSQPHALEQLVPKLQASVAAKNISFWSSSTSFQNDLNQFLPIDSPQPGNWLKIVQNNIGGLKSSRSVYQQVTIESHTNLFQDSTKYDVTITRTHEGTGAWPDGENINYSEIYLPPAAVVTQLPQNRGGQSALTIADQKALGTLNKQWTTTETDTSSWKKISFWSTTNVAEKTTYNLSYTLPNTDTFNQNLLYLKEAGSTHETLIVNGTSYSVASNITAPL